MTWLRPHAAPLRTITTFDEFLGHVAEIRAAANATPDLLAESRDRSAGAENRAVAAADRYIHDPRCIPQATLPPPRDPDPLVFGPWYEVPEEVHRGYYGIRTCRECGVQWKSAVSGKCWACGTEELAPLFGAETNEALA